MVYKTVIDVDSFQRYRSCNYCNLKELQKSQFSFHQAIKNFAHKMSIFIWC